MYYLRLVRSLPYKVLVLGAFLTYNDAYDYAESLDASGYLAGQGYVATIKETDEGLPITVYYVPGVIGVAHMGRILIASRSKVAKH